jgi:uncharacterized protein
MNESSTEVRITALHNYPVKSLRGNPLARATLTTQGIAGDRAWMVVDRNGHFLTQRELPAMATITVREHGKGITLEHDMHGTITAQANENAVTNVKVWRSDVLGLDAGDAAAQWLTDALDTHVRLVRFDDRTPRVCNPLFAGDSGAHTRFADGYPVLVTNVASLDDLNGRMSKRLGMERFRPNIVVEGIAAWEEDHIDILTCGGVQLKFVKPCVRCQVTTTDQTTGARSSDEPLTSLGRFRTNPDLGGVTFGVNAIVLQGGVMRVGDTLDVALRF